MTVPADLAAAVLADLGRGRQEELPLSNVDARGRSYMPPQVDESKNYDPRIKADLNSKWSTAIADEESAQMQGLTNLNARPWASSQPQQPSRFEIPKSVPTVPRHVTAPAAQAPRQTAAPVPPPMPSPAPPVKTTKNHILDTGKCRVSMNEGQIVVPDASFCVAVSAQNDAAFFMLTAPGKPPVCLHVLGLEVPVIYGTSCIIKTKPEKGAASAYTITPLPPSTADRLARVLENIQIALRKALKLEPVPKPSQPLMPQVAKVAPTKTSAPAYTSTPPPRSLLCADSPDSSPEASPRFSQSQLVEVAVKKQRGKTSVNLDDVINSIDVIVRTAYYQITGCSVPLRTGASSREQSSDVALAEWLTKGHLDSDADETKRGLVDILRFLKDLQLKNAAAREPPMMSSQTMEVFKTIDRGIKSPGGGPSYSASEIIALKKDAVVPEQMTAAAVPKEMASSAVPKETPSLLASRNVPPNVMPKEASSQKPIKKGLSGSLWAK